ncbi:ABC transporter family substrate-binding protein [Pseudonocardia asaccharolytica]|uniref:Peptide ABC transporter substrate-binding protein n=1 Tax=Pseudonocardia asaccharolytica DSM 44247 = NBRC 16224 TaxID=1123024 RepID=A0A511D6I4_9PSEU|nr:ABC transporter family substrate-binding protein [Pseudonocardia asaccharolytica]GEL18558.1 peptide ABC transporter substrate-binding protein [Pseudonocardia asaccharolytica DSM 44247 = NBRC 16224]
MTRIGAIARAVVVLLMAALLAACVDRPAPRQPPPPPPTTVAPAEPTELVIGIDDLGAGFNPHLLAHQSVVTTALATLVLPSVFRPDETGTLHLDPTIATSATVVATEPFTVSYELNVKASWSTNAPIAAEDFVYLWEQMRSQSGTVDAAGYKLITDVRSRAGGKAVDVVFSRPYPQWQQLFSALLPAHILKDAPGSWTGGLAGGLPASGGPFRIASVDRARGELLLARNDLYWATPTALDQIVLRRVDPTTMADGLRAGGVDVGLPAASPAVREALAALGPGVRIQDAPRPVVTGLGMRSDAGPVSDPRVRQGIAWTLDREALRATIAPDALPADAFGLAPSEPGYAPTAPDGAPVRPDPGAAERAFAAAGYARDGDGRWSRDGQPLRLVVGAAAERPQDVRLAEAVAAQLDAAGIGAVVVAPPAVDLFGGQAVPATPPPTTAAPTPTATPNLSPSPTPSTVPTMTPTPAPAPGGGVRVDLMVLPRVVGGDLGSRLASDYGCPRATTGVADPPATPTGFCFPALQPILSRLLTGPADPETVAAVERVLWAQLPALPLFQPVTLVVSTPTADAATGIGPGPLGTGPVTGAQRWVQPGG